MRYRVRHETLYTYRDRYSGTQNHLRMTPRTTPYQQVLSHEITVSPKPVRVDQYNDWLGNSVTSFGLLDDADHLTISAESEVEVASRSPTPAKVDLTKADAWESVVTAVRDPADVAAINANIFAADSAYISRSAALAAYASESFTVDRPVFDATVDLTKRIHQDFKFDPAATTISTRVEEVFKGRRGVCQDFAHLQIACLRSIGLAARYVSGYLRTNPPPGGVKLVGADASHAWVAVWCPPFGWVDFDPTNNCVVGLDHITVAWGSDYGEVSPVKGVTLGGGGQRVEVRVDVCPVVYPPSHGNARP